MAENKTYHIKIQGELVPVTQEVYLVYYRMQAREKYLERRDRLKGTVFYSCMDTPETLGEDAIPDLESDSIEDSVIVKILVDKLNNCLKSLTDSELELITALFFEDKSEREWSATSGIPNMTIHDRKVKILAKLKKLLEI